MKGGPETIIQINCRDHFSCESLTNRIVSAFVDKRGARAVNGQEYDYESFPDFANVILDGAEKSKCNISTNCVIDNHVK